MRSASSRCVDWRLACALSSAFTCSCDPYSGGMLDRLFLARGIELLKISEGEGWHAGSPIFGARYRAAEHFRRRRGAVAIFGRARGAPRDPACRRVVRFFV